MKFIVVVVWKINKRTASSTHFEKLSRMSNKKVVIKLVLIFH
jgi:hypothetical protein